MSESKAMTNVHGSSKVKPSAAKPPAPEDDLVDLAFEAALEKQPESQIASVRVLVRTMRDQLDVLTSLGNEPLPGFIANGFSEMLGAMDEKLAIAMQWARHNPFRQEAGRG